MRDELAGPAFDIILHGLKLRDRVAAGDRPQLGAEQAKFKGWLGPANSPAPWGSAHDPTQSIEMRESEFLGMRYALVCWLDEIMIDAGWREWDENKLELSMYRTNVRYGNFWQQARLADAIPSSSDAPEVFLLCTLLGFRGEYGEDPQRLKEWVETTRSRVTRSMGKEPPPLPEKAPETNVPLLLGVESYRKMTQRFVIALLIAVPLVAFLLVLNFR
jgi:type IV/VI secretion system ImpK/VasF family protein